MDLSWLSSRGCNASEVGRPCSMVIDWLYLEGIIANIYSNPTGGRGELLPTIPESFGFLGSNVKLPQELVHTCTAFLLAGTNRANRPHVCFIMTSSIERLSS